MILAKKCQRFQPVHAGELVVKQDQIKIRVQGSELKSALAMTRFQDFDLLVQALQYLAQALAHQRMIVDYKNFQHLE